MRNSSQWRIQLSSWKPRATSVDERCRVTVSFAMARPIVYVALVATLAAIVVADFGPCTFDENLCSCKYGSPTQGRCWDHVTNTPGICASRWCNAGWTCACGGRTHTCYIHRHFPIKIADGDKQKETAPCPIDPATNQPGVEAKDSASEPEISLGAFKFEISPKGVAANECVYSFNPCLSEPSTFLKIN